MKTKYEKFADSWKSISLSSKLKYQAKQLHENAIFAVMSQLIDRFGDDAKELIADVCYQIGLSDGKILSKKATLSSETLHGTVEPIEIMCLLSGIELDTIEGDGCITIRMYTCPYKDVLAGICNTGIVCENHMHGLLQSRNRSAFFTHAKKMCEGGDHCEILVSIDTDEPSNESE